MGRLRDTIWETFMEHEFHLSEDVDRSGPAIRALILACILVGFCAVGAYVVYGSGLWHAEVQHTDQ